MATCIMYENFPADWVLICSMEPVLRWSG
ncbi:hypothetical protein LZ609_21425 [Pantoea agglomerans]|nr:hypothetical protein [Pantoea agglomerans]UOV21022.1 hypothetical protein LZ609_21425 [Pantoea agglomerans]